MVDMKRHWKEPVNGLTVFFSEDSYTRVLGTVSLEERLATKSEEDQYSSQFTLTPLTPYQAKSAPPLAPSQKTHVGPTNVKKKNDEKEVKAAQAPAQKSGDPKGAVDSKKLGPVPPKLKGQKSSLSSKEQRRYLELFQKYLMSYRPQQPSLAEIKELTEFEALQVRVSTEQAAFLQYTEQVAKCRHFDYNHLLPAARKYVNEKLNWQWRRVDNYVRHYIPDRTIPLVVTTDKDYSPTLNHDKLLLELGTFPKVFMPDMTRQNEVPTHYDKVNKRYPSGGRKTASNKVWNHEACSRDTNAELLAQRHSCQLVTCGSALRCLVDNHTPKFKRDWEIPVIIRQYEHDYGDISTKQKVVYIDKPFASKAMSTREKNTLYHKYALKAFITQPSYPRGHKPVHATSNVKDEQQKKLESANPFDEDVSMEDLETFGSLDFGKPQKPSSVKKTDSSSVNKLESFKSLPLTNDKSLQEKEKLRSEKSEPETSKTEKINPKSDSVHVGDKEQGKDPHTKVESENSVKSSEDKDSETQKSTQPGDTGKPTQETVKKHEEESGRVNIPSSSGGDTSHDESLVIDVPDLPSPPIRTTRARAKRTQSAPAVNKEPSKESPPRKSSPRLTRQTGVKKPPAQDVGKTSKSAHGSSVVGASTAESSDDEHELVIDLGESLSPEKRKTRSQTTEEFSVPKRVLRKRKSTETQQSVESDSDPSPDSQSVRLTRARSASGSKSRSNSESKAKEEIAKKDENVTKCSHGSRRPSARLNQEEESVNGKSDVSKDTQMLNTDIIVSPSKVDNIMIKTSTDDLSNLPPTREAKVASPQKAGIKRSRLESKTGLSPLDSILQLQEKMLPTGRSKSDMSGHGVEENLSEFRHPEEHNVSYNLWTFSGITLLIRSSCHGVLKDLAQKAKPVCIVPKLEYQTKFGVEQVTQSEVSRDWISCHVKPNTKLIRGRINALTSELIKMDELDLGAIANPSLSFVPGHALGSLHNLFLKLTELPAGQYILKHAKGDNSCELLKSTDTKRGAYDLKFSYMGFGPSAVSNDDSDVPWIPIDPTVLLPVHRRQGRIPCTFEPADYVHQPAMKKVNKKKKKKGQKKQWQGKGRNTKT